ncbi:MAG: hypothetical protein ACRDIB_02550, partial [Ardenticatenaceae bacterium]
MIQSQPLPVTTRPRDISNPIARRIGLARGRVALVLVLCVALVQGLLYLRLLPPWQHYDEPTHFEYTWLYAKLGRQPGPQDVDPVMRREVAASMMAHDFYWNLSKPNLLDTKAPI